MKRTLAALVTASSACLALVGCGSSSLDSGSPAATTSASVAAVSADPALTAKLPAAIQASKTIQVGIDATYKPNEYLDSDGKTIIGMDVDMLNAVAAKLGVTAHYNNSPFSAILNGVVAKKYDVGMSSFTVTAEREKSVNMVTYLSAGTLWATKAGNPAGVDRAKPCGKTVTVQNATTQLDELNAANKGVCRTNPVKILPFTDQSAVNTAMMSGRADAMAADSPISQYAIKESAGKLAPLGEVYGSAPYGVVVQKDQLALAQAIQEALTAVKAGGQYDAILDKWGQKDSGVTAFQLNPSAS